MSAASSTKPYLLRAMYEWCADNGYTPYIAVKVQGLVHVPMEFVTNGDIVLNISMNATSGLEMDNEAISFKARFGGIEHRIYVPVSAVAAIYASENNQGMAFEVVLEPLPESAVASSSKHGKDGTKDETTEALSSEKPAISLAVTNTENSSTPNEKKSKEGRKKPSFTVIK